MALDNSQEPRPHLLGAHRAAAQRGGKVVNACTLELKRAGSSYHP